MTVDVLIVGTGPAGLSAGLSATRAGLETTVLEAGSIGGELVDRNTIENLPDHPSVSGIELRSTLVEQFREAGGSITLGTVERVHDDYPFLVTTIDGEYRSRSVILATGGVPTPLGVPGEEAFDGHGVSSIVRRVTAAVRRRECRRRRQFGLGGDRRPLSDEPRRSRRPDRT